MRQNRVESWIKDFDLSVADQRTLYLASADLLRSSRVRITARSNIACVEAQIKDVVFSVCAAIVLPVHVAGEVPRWLALRSVLQHTSSTSDRALRSSAADAVFVCAQKKAAGAKDAFKLTLKALATFEVRAQCTHSDGCVIFLAARHELCKSFTWAC